MSMKTSGSAKDGTLTYTVTTPPCPVCRETSEVVLTARELMAVNIAKSGMGVGYAKALPAWTAAQRDLFFRGTHEDCWKAAMAKVETGYYVDGLGASGFPETDEDEANYCERCTVPIDIWDTLCQRCEDEFGEE